MATKEVSEPLKVGTRVMIRNSGYKNPARIIEFRGTLGPKGARVYRLRIGKKPFVTYIEVLEEQLEVLHPVDEK